MSISASDVVPTTQARAHLSELADEVKAGAEKVILENGERYVALMDADRRAVDATAHLLFIRHHRQLSFGLRVPATPAPC